VSVAAADIMRGPMGAAFELFAGIVSYSRGAGTWPLKAAVRDFKGVDVFGSAAVGDRLAVVRQADFVQLGIGAPARYDIVTLVDGTFVVIDWRAAPAVETPVFYRLALRGGTR
jgi:hypothetical protein